VDHAPGMLAAEQRLVEHQQVGLELADQRQRGVGAVAVDLAAFGRLGGDWPKSLEDVERYDPQRLGHRRILVMAVPPGKPLLTSCQAPHFGRKRWTSPARSR